MRSQGSAPELERRRQLAVVRVSEGYPQQEVAAFLGVHRGTVSRWVCTARDQGADALQAKPTPGRPRKLSARQEKTVLGPGWPSRRRVSVFPPTCGRAGGWRLSSSSVLACASTATIWSSGCVPASTRPRSPPNPPGSATKKPSPAGGDQDWPCLQKKREQKKRTSC